MKLSLLASLCRSIAVFVLVWSQVGEPLFAQQATLPTAPNVEQSNHQEWDPFNDALLYFSDFDEVQRIDRWVFTTDGTTGAQKSELVGSGPLLTMPMNNIPSATYCVPRCVRNGEIFLYFHAGGDKQTYEQARRPSTTLESWSSTVNVIVTGRSVSNVTLFTYNETLELNQERPEQLVVKHATQYFQNSCSTTVTDPLDKLYIQIVSYSAPAVVAVQPFIRLEVGFKEEINIDANKTGTVCGEPESVLLEYPNHTYDDNGNKHSISSTLHFSPSANPASTVLFQWSTTGYGEYTCSSDSFPNWQFQLLKLYNTDKTLDNSDPDIRRVGAIIDWSQALTLETGSKKQELSLTMPEGDGLYIWRVRPIGTYFEGGITNPQNWGCWSPSPQDGDKVQVEYSFLEAQPTPPVNRVYLITGGDNKSGDWSAFYYRQFDNDKNWSYNRSFAETGTDGLRIGEGIVYANDMMSPTQVQAKLQSDNTVLAAQSVYDFSGSPTLRTLPAPIPDQSTLKYKSQLLTSGSDLYSAHDFDELTNPGVPQTASGPIATYYSSSNTDPSIPSAEGYPFATSRFYKDGRLREQGAVGNVHQVGETTPRTSRIAYASVTDKELVSIFGDEAPAPETVSKVITTDPNNVVSARYISSDGQLLASFLVDAGELPSSIPTGKIESSTGNPLMNLEGEYVNILSIEDKIDNKNGALLDANTYRTAKTYVFTKPTSLTLDYKLTPNNGQNSCLNYCMTCDYKVQVRIINMETGAVVYSKEHSITPSGNLISEDGCETSDELHLIPGSPSVFPLTVGPGTFIVERTITTNNPATSPDLPAAEWHAHKAVERIKPLEDILKELHLVADGETPPSLDAYNEERSEKNSLYAWVDLVTDASDLSECSGLSLPPGECPDGCPAVGVNTFPSFEQYLFETLGEEPDQTLDLNNWFRNSDGSEKYPESFPAYTSGYGLTGATTETFPEGYRMFDELVGNMIADGYNCKQLWKCWQAVVAQFKALRGNTSGVPSLRGQTYDLLQAFLDCAAVSCQNKSLDELMVGGASQPYGVSTGFHTYSSVGFLSHAHKYFSYTDAASPCSTMVAATYGAYPWIGHPEAWQELYSCLRANSNISIDMPGCRGADGKIVSVPDFPIIVDESDPGYNKPEWDAFVECMLSTAKKPQQQCETRCDELRPDFEKAIEASHPGITPLEMECLVEALVQNCRSGCEATFAVSYVNYPPQSSDDVIITTNCAEQNEAISRRIRGKFKVQPSQDEGCPTADPAPYERAISNSTVLKLLANFLTKRFDYYAQTVSTPTLVNFYDEAKSFLLSSGTAECLETGGIIENFTNVLVYPGAKGTFVVVNDDQETEKPEDDCCSLFFHAEWEELPVIQAHALNSFLDKTWGKEFATYTPQHSYAVANTNFLNYAWGSGGSSSLPNLPYYSHVYYDRSGLEPLTDSIRLYGHILNNEGDTSNTDAQRNGIANFKILPGMGDGDFSNELSGIIASKTTDLFAYSTTGTVGDIGTWRGFGTVVIQLPRTSLNQTAQKIVVRLTRDNADSIRLTGIRVDRQIGGVQESLPYTTTLSGDEFLDFTNLPFTESIGRFVVNQDGVLAFETTGENTVTIPFAATNFRYTRETSASISYNAETCVLCQPNACAVCIAWQDAVEPDIDDQPYVDFVPSDCEQKEIDRIKANIIRKYADLLQNVEKQMLNLYAETCASPDKITDNLTVSYGAKFYHYTLFYYDRAGRLVRTVPPKGIDFTNTNTRTRSVHPNHTMETRYDYNTLGQLIRKITPDEGGTTYWYDSKGRLRFSQKAYQVAGNNYLYFNYDELGRIVETGEFTSTNITALLETSITTGLRDITKFVFTTPSTFNWGTAYGTLAGRNTRNRIVAVMRQNVGESNTVTDDWARTSFSYDEHGNPEWVISTTGKDNVTSDITKIAAQTFYEYDIASGNVTKVRYREGFADQFFKRYKYDADNRLIDVESSRDNVLWETDASYAFYPHGPMRRTMLGADSVQGIDYTYTIQGWLKAINHPSLDVQYDPGADGNSISGTTNKTKFGKDVFGMALGYFPGDFLHTSSPFHSGTGALTYNLNTGNQLYDGTVTYPLYDGTITTQSSFIRPPQGTPPDIEKKQFKELVGETYRYDRLYRLRSVYFGPYQYAPPDNQDKPKWYMDGDYESHYKYDANGNFTYLRRWGRIAGPPYNVLSVNKKMDEVGEYVYTSGTNRLESFVESSYMTPFFTDDIDGEYMLPGNYVYDASGRMTTDKMEGVKPKWDVYDKVVEVVNNNGPLSSGESTPNASSKKIRYRYDGAGQRVQRLVFNFNATNGDFEAEPALVQSYVYGVGGELLGVYEQKYIEGELQDNAELKEWPLDGMGRVGLAQPDGMVAHLGTLRTATDKYNRPVDKKRYELTDHLGNVRAVVSDLKLDDGNGSFLPDIKAYYNYYAFGMLHPNRSWEAESYRFGFNGVEKENDVTVKGGIAMADFRMYDPRVGRWWGVDKIVKPGESPYAAFFNNPINFADPSGLNGTRQDEGGGEAGPPIKVTEVKTESTGDAGQVHVPTPKPKVSQPQESTKQESTPSGTTVQTTKNIETVTDKASTGRTDVNKNGNEKGEDIVVFDPPQSKYNIDLVTDAGSPFGNPGTSYTLLGTDEGTAKLNLPSFKTNFGPVGVAITPSIKAKWDKTDITDPYNRELLKSESELKVAVQYKPWTVANPLALGLGESKKWSPVVMEGFATTSVDNMTGQTQLKLGYGGKVSSPQFLWWTVEAKAEYSRKFRGINWKALAVSFLPPVTPNTATIKAPITGFSYSHPYIKNALIQVYFNR